MHVPTHAYRTLRRSPERAPPVSSARIERRFRTRRIVRIASRILSANLTSL